MRFEMLKYLRFYWVQHDAEITMLFEQNKPAVVEHGLGSFKIQTRLTEKTPDWMYAASAFSSVFSSCYKASTGAILRFYI